MKLVRFLVETRKQRSGVIHYFEKLYNEGFTVNRVLNENSDVNCAA